MSVGRGAGFTLVELLIVIAIISLLAALLFPAIQIVICMSREGSAQHLIGQLEMAIASYSSDHGKPPPGNGTGSRELAAALQNHYFEFRDGMLSTGTLDIVNPVHTGSSGVEGILHYRNNLLPGGIPNPPPVHKKGIDIWAAGCGYPGGGPASAWALRN